MGDVHSHGGGHMVPDIAHGHSAGIQAHDHVIDVSQAPGAFGNHGGKKRPCPVSGNVYGNRPVIGINRLRVGAIAVIISPSCRFSFPITGLIAEVGIHLSIQTSGNRGLQHAAHQVIGIRRGGA